MVHLANGAEAVGEFSYLPRAAVAKYIKLCKVCSLKASTNKPPALNES